MESKLFDEFDPLDESNKQFRQHLVRLLELSEDDQRLCVEALADFAIADTRQANMHVVKSIQAHSKLSAVEILQALNLLYFFLKTMLKEATRSDLPEQWRTDLVNIGVLQEPHDAMFHTLTQRLRAQVLPRVERTLRRERASSGVLPTLKGVGVTVELRAVRENRYHWDTDIQYYRPKIIDIVGIASISIGVDEGTPEDFYFQVDERSLQRLIDSLIAAKRDLEALVADVCFTPSNDEHGRET